jgi:hypothetical protein
MTLDQYTAALKSQDWFYEYSDDHRAWQAGKDAMEALRLAQRQLDPQALIWNEHAPKECRISRN